MFLSEFCEKYQVGEEIFLVDGALRLQWPVIATGSDSNTSHTEIGMASNVSFVQ